MKPLLALPLVAALATQGATPSARELLNMARRLTVDEIATVFSASRAALAGKSIRLSSVINRQDGPEILVGRTGQPKLIRLLMVLEGGMVSGEVSSGGTAPAETHWTEEIRTIIEYTGRRARRCDGSTADAEMVIEYTRRGSSETWAATARARAARDTIPTFTAPFELLKGTGTIASVAWRTIDGELARAFVTAWKPPASGMQSPVLTGDPAPNVAGIPMSQPTIQTLWIGANSALPLRWEVTTEGIRTDGFDFKYIRNDLRTPRGVAAPACIQ